MTKNIVKSLAWMGTAIGLAGVATGLISPKAIAQTIKATLVRDSDNPALQPFQVNATCQGVIWTCVAHITNVPAGKRLVIEHVDAFLPTSFPDPGVAFLTTTVNGQSVQRVVTIRERTARVSPTLLMDSRVYADPATSVDLTVEYAGDVNLNFGAAFTLHVSGHLISL